MGDFKDSKIYNVNDFIGWHRAGLLKLSPKYQRNQIWNLKAKSYLIDTIVRGLPVPQVFLRQTTDVKTLQTLREVIDGQQRLTAIIEFINDDFAILKTHNLDYAGNKYSDLDEEIQENILNFELSVELIKSKDDAVIYDMFSRVNTNSMTVNKQELRNAKYWGEFKVFVYKQATEWRNIFIENGIFKDNNLARMLDVEFVSSLAIQILDGIISETPSKIDEYYKRFDEKFERIEEVERKMNTIREVIIGVFEDETYNTKIFKNKNYFYTLFTIINNELYNVDGLDVGKKLVDENELTAELLVWKLMNFESKFSDYQNNNIYDDITKKDFEIIEKNHKSRTTNASERKTRVRLVYKYLL
ncbi:DUF262 domain-containing protein [Exiguobacterium aurantiacum]|uniref:DUF262 domain-containing protein n=1 Tax=Exiguobacterium aurantiacum TaxID=33987 RepID=UPI0038505F16